MDVAGDFPIRFLVTLAALAVVLLLAWAVIRFVANLTGQRATGRRLKVLETITLGSRERLVLVQFDSRELLVGVSSNHVNLIDAGNQPAGNRPVFLASPAGGTEKP